jgi:hypothetical protein
MVRSIPDAISLIEPTQNPFLEWLGMSSANDKWPDLVPSTKIEWNEDAMAAMADTVAADVADATVTTIQVTDGSLWKAGDVGLVDLEYVHVTSISTNTLTLTRNFGGTAASHASTTAIYIRGAARLEGATGDFDVMTTAEQPYNYTSIVQVGVKVTGSAAKQKHLGIDDLSAYEGDKAMKRLARKMEFNLFHGQLKDGSATTPRSMGGLKTFITTAGNYVAVGGAIHKSNIDTLMEYCINDGGNPDTLWVSPGVFADICREMDDYVYTSAEQTEGTLGRVPVTRIRTQFGEIGVKWDLNIPDADGFLLQQSLIGMYEFRAPFQQNLSITGDFFPSEIIAEHSLVVEHGLTAHGRLGTMTT